MKEIVDITNKKFGLLVPQKSVRINNLCMWECKCECGNTVYRPYRALNEAQKKGIVSSCGCGKIIIDGEPHTVVGQRVGKIVVNSFDTKTLLYTCTDKKGKTFILSLKDIRKRYTCADNIYNREKEQHEIAIRYNCENHEDYVNKKKRLYCILSSMRQRCYNTSSLAYKDYGGRGIVICNEWLHNATTFVHWALLNGYDYGLQIDRINNNGNYEPSNCRFVTQQVNANNKRSNLFIEYNGKRQTLKQWCVELGLPYRQTHTRIYTLHWTIERAFTLRSSML